MLAPCPISRITLLEPFISILSIRGGSRGLRAGQRWLLGSTGPWKRLISDELRFSLQRRFRGARGWPESRIDHPRRRQRQGGGYQPTLHLERGVRRAQQLRERRSQRGGEEDQGVGQVIAANEPSAEEKHAGQRHTGASVCEREFAGRMHVRRERRED